MQFNTYIFVLAFLPITIVGYFLCGKIQGQALQRIFLILTSLLFYGFGGIEAFMWFIFSSIFNYLTMIVLKKKVGRKPIILWGNIFGNIALLFYFKYLNFVLVSTNTFFHTSFHCKNLILPLGISFFTFQQISYVLDSYHGKNVYQSFGDYMLYITYFPKILMGPIVKPQDLLAQFYDPANQKPNTENLALGIQKFNIGLFKKVLLADTFSKAVTWGFDNVQTASAIDLVIVMLAYTFQIYFDFSGYSDMAIGISQMLNIVLPQNFDSPYKAYSIRDFWKRWHMSLTGFLTEYIYIPLGGSKKGKLHTYLNTMIVFLISGIWHGANWTFILWGILHGALSVFDRITEKHRNQIHSAMQWMATFAAINVLWLLFRADNIYQWFTMLVHMVMLQNTTISNDLIAAFMQPELVFFLKLAKLEFLCDKIRGFPMLLYIVGALVMCLCFDNSNQKEYKNSSLSAVLSAALFVGCLTCFGGEAVFLYNNF